MRNMFFFASLILVAGLSIAVNAGETPDSSQKAILVTGASSGIGRMLTERLASEGYLVYATARKDSDLQSLASIKNVHPLKLDVTKPEEIDAAVAAVTQGGRGLYALVNNAGIGSGAPLVEMKTEEFDTQMAVNVDGPFRVTRSFAPLIVAGKGRIVNISSISGVLSSPNAGAYQMSKHAIEAFGDVLAKELAASGVQVSLIEPGSYNSDIARKGYERTGTGAERADRSKLKEPLEVVDAIELALFEAKPKRRYMVTPNAEQAEVSIKALMEKVVQFNEDQVYTYDRDTLVKMLDEALGQARPQSSANQQVAALSDFAIRYTAAWNSQNAASVAAFFATSGSLKINTAKPAVGSAAITKSAQSFMTAFPDLFVKMDKLTVDGKNAVYCWTLTGTDKGPHGKGNTVRISGYEEWRLDDAGLIAESKGHYDAADYKRQLTARAADKT